MKAYTLRNLRFAVQKEYDLTTEISRKLSLSTSEFHFDQIIRKSLDTRKHNHPIYDFTVQLCFMGKPPRHPDLAAVTPIESKPKPDIQTTEIHPFIIGMGPAGLFCALAMVKNGLQPWLFDQGDALEERAGKVNQFWQNGSLDEDSNVQFGEGGAGAFSDGKLTNRGKDPHIHQVFAEMVRYGADPAICYEALPHLGTDGIRAMVKSIRNYLLERGCRFHYRSKLEDMDISGGRVRQLRISGQSYSPDLVIAGLGNSARSTFQMLHKRGIQLEPKSFALGFRIEHEQAAINRSVYGSEQWAETIGPAVYRLTSLTGFTFCMCPGGEVIAASSENGGVVTNGMSFASRGNQFCNSAIVTPVSALDYGDGLWDGMKMQSRIEQLAWRQGYLAPVQKVESFIHGIADGKIPAGTYRPGVFSLDMGTLFFPEITNRLKAALIHFDSVLPGFKKDAVLIAPETRTSSPLRMLRDKELLSGTGIENFFPIGEGSGYAGGIVSSAVDGWRVGERVKYFANSQ